MNPDNLNAAFAGAAVGGLLMALLFAIHATRVSRVNRRLRVAIDSLVNQNAQLWADLQATRTAGRDALRDMTSFAQSWGNAYANAIPEPEGPESGDGSD